MWIKSDSFNAGYVYMSADTVAKHTKISCRNITSTDNIQASDGGCWVRAHNWWERSPQASGIRDFIYVYYGGYPNYGAGAAGTLGVVVGFSI